MGCAREKIQWQAQASKSSMQLNFEVLKLKPVEILTATQTWKETDVLVHLLLASNIHLYYHKQI